MKKKTIIIVSFFGGIFLIVILAVFCTLEVKIHGNTSGDLRKMKENSYQSLFISSYEPDVFPNGIYKKYIGIDNLPCSKEITTFQTMGNYLETAFETDNVLSYVFIVVDPLPLWKNSFYSATLFNKLFNKELLSVIDGHQECKFIVLFAPFSKEFWREQSDRTFDCYIESVSIMAEQLGNRENVTLNYVQDEEWLVCNSGAYTDSYYLTDEAADYVMTLALGGYITKSKDEVIAALSTMKKWKTADQDSEQYGDLADCAIVYLGDSIFGNCQNFSSIPNVVGALTGACCINLGMNGASAAHQESETLCFQGIMNNFLSQKEQLVSGYNRLCFVIHFGLNDYFGGRSMTEFTNGMVEGIRALRIAYPEAVIVLLSPYTVTAFQNGTEFFNGSPFILKDYQKAIETLSQQENTLFLDMQEALGWKPETAEENLSDKVHPNYKGRFRFAQILGKYLTREFEAF